jgi:hypothetical protein
MIRVSSALNPVVATRRGFLCSAHTRATATEVVGVEKSITPSHSMRAVMSEEYATPEEPTASPSREELEETNAAWSAFDELESNASTTW